MKNLTPLEITLIIILWVIVGFWILMKRNWYKDSLEDKNNFRMSTEEDRLICCVLCIVGSPVSLIVALFRVFIIPQWKNK